MTSQGKQRARADARAVVQWCFRRPGKIGRRTAQRAASPIRQGHNNISRAARRMQRHQRQKLTTKRVMPIRYRDVGHQPVTDGGSLQVLGSRQWLALQKSLHYVSKHPQQGNESDHFRVKRLISRIGTCLPSASMSPRPVEKPSLPLPENRSYRR